jgi:hypothetical protein
MTEYETIAPEISENITQIGNQQESKGETRLMKLSNTAHGVLSHYETGSYTAQSYYKSTINNYIRENWNGDIERYGNKNRVIYRSEHKVWHDQGKELSYALSFIKANARSSNLDSGTKFAMMLSYQIDIANAYCKLIFTGIYGLSVLKTKNLEMRRKYNNFAEIGYPTISDYNEVLDLKRRQDWRELDWSELSQGTDYDYDTHQIQIGRLDNLTFLHQSLTKEGSVAYYRDLADMKRGREIVTTFGKYLARFRDFLGLNEKQIKQLADNYLTLHAGFNDLSLDYIDGRCENNQESVNEQQDKWFNAYHEDNSSERYERCHSCMTNKRAVKVYANPKSVLKLAVLKDEQGYIHGRSIVRDDEHKGYIRLYPHASESKLGNFLKQKLSADGYTDRVNLNGVYLDGKWLSEYDSYSVPYIDGQSHDELGEKWVYAVEKTINDRDYLHIESEYDTDFYLENTNGRSYQDSDDEDDNYTYCENCDESIHEDDAHTLDQERLCLSCFEDVAREVITPQINTINYHNEFSRDENGLPICEGRSFPEDRHRNSSDVFKIVDSYKDKNYVGIDSGLDDKRFDLYMNVAGYVRPLFMNPRFDSLQDPFNRYFDDDDYNYTSNEYSTRFNGLKYWSKSHDLMSTEFGWLMSEKTYKVFLDLEYLIRRPKIFVGKEYNKVCKMLGVKNILPEDFIKVTFNTYVTPDDILVTLPTDESQYIFRGEPRKITHVHKTRVKTLPNGTTCQIDNPDFIYLP